MSRLRAWLHGWGFGYGLYLIGFSHQALLLALGVLGIVSGLYGGLEAFVLDRKEGRRGR